MYLLGCYRLLSSKGIKDSNCQTDIGCRDPRAWGWGWWGGGTTHVYHILHGTRKYHIPPGIFLGLSSSSKGIRDSAAKRPLHLFRDRTRRGLLLILIIRHSMPAQCSMCGIWPMACWPTLCHVRYPRTPPPLRSPSRHATEPLAPSAPRDTPPYHMLYISSGSRGPGARL